MASRRACGAALCLLVLLPAASYALDNGLGLKPPLGFNTWNYFGCNINETVVMSAADKLISLGLADAGYTYLNLDDCWHTRTRGGDGNLQADPAKFPSGMAAIGEAIHAKGLRFGIYSDSGLLTCAGFPGSRYHEQADAALFASWAVDYLKYDNCFASSDDVRARYTDMRDALNSTGRPIYFSMCNWGVAAPWLWGPRVGNSWRTDQDIAADWDSILRSLDNGAAGLAQFAGPGGWNDPDMLEVGNGDLTVAQQRSHFALWALVKAPLLIGANLDTISATSLDILRAKEVIAVHQDALGVPGDIIWKQGPLEVWAAPLAGGARAVVLFNRHFYGPPAVIRVTWAQLGLIGPQEGQEEAGAAGPAAAVRARVRDLYAQRVLGEFEGGFEAAVANYDVAVLRVTPVAQPSGSNGGAAWQLPGAVRRAAAWALAALARGTQRLQAGLEAGAVPAARWHRQAGVAVSTSSSSSSAWRPWHGAAAAQLQAELRANFAAAAAVARAAAGGVRTRRRRRPALSGQHPGAAAVAD